MYPFPLTPPPGRGDFTPYESAPQLRGDPKNSNEGCNNEVVALQIIRRIIPQNTEGVT